MIIMNAIQVLKYHNWVVLEITETVVKKMKLKIVENLCALNKAKVCINRCHEKCLNVTDIM